MKSLSFRKDLIGVQDELLRFAYKLTTDREEANDLLQETSLKALDNEEKYAPDTNFKGWMYTIMRNIFINNYRRKTRQQTIFDNSSNDFLLDYNQHAVNNAAEVNLKMKDIQEAIQKLPDIFQHPFVMYFEGYKYNEIAELLHEPLGTIKSRIHFARKLLKEQLTRF